MTIRFTFPALEKMSTRIGPTWSSSITDVCAFFKGRRCASIRLKIVAMVGCPARGISSAGVKSRARKSAIFERITNDVSERFISRAMESIVASSRSSASRRIAHGLPASGCSVKASTWKNGYLVIDPPWVLAVLKKVAGRSPPCVSARIRYRLQYRRQFRWSCKKLRIGPSWHAYWLFEMDENTFIMVRYRRQCDFPWVKSQQPRAALPAGGKRSERADCKRRVEKRRSFAAGPRTGIPFEGSPYDCQQRLRKAWRRRHSSFACRARHVCARRRSGSAQAGRCGARITDAACVGNAVCFREFWRQTANHAESLRGQKSHFVCVCASLIRIFPDGRVSSRGKYSPPQERPENSKCRPWSGLCSTLWLDCKKYSRPIGKTGWSNDYQRVSKLVEFDSQGSCGSRGDSACWKSNVPGSP